MKKTEIKAFTINLLGLFVLFLNVVIISLMISIEPINVMDIVTTELVSTEVIEDKRDYDTINITRQRNYSENVIEYRQTDYNYAQPIIAITEHEFEMICAVIEHEVGYVSYESKVAVCDLIINRVLSDDFPDTVAEVLHQSGQFGAIDNYYTNEYPTSSETIRAVFSCLYKQETSHDAIYYANLSYCSNRVANWFRSLDHEFSLDGQDFYK